MRTKRIALALAASALAPALLASAPAFAADAAQPAATVAVTSPTGTGVDDLSDDDVRVAIARILYTATQNGDRAVIREANEALDGTIEDQRAFLETGYRLAQAEDDAVAVNRILYKALQNGDKAVIREANKVLDDGTPETLRAFLETGYRLAQAEDDRVAVARILADPTISAALRAAAEDVMDGTPEELRYFLEVGRYEVGQ